MTNEDAVNNVSSTLDLMTRYEREVNFRKYERAVKDLKHVGAGLSSEEYAAELEQLTERYRAGAWTPPSFEHSVLKRLTLIAVFTAILPTLAVVGLLLSIVTAGRL